MNKISEGLSIYKLVAFNEKLLKLQLEELYPLIDKIRGILSKKCEKIVSEKLIGHYYKATFKGFLVYLTVDGFNQTDGSLSVRISYPIRGKTERLGCKGRKLWVCSYWDEDGTYSVYSPKRQVVLEEITKKEFEVIEKVTKWKKA